MFENFWKTQSKFFGSDFPIMCGAMSWLSEHKLVSTISNCGGFGVIACGSMLAPELEKEILLTKELTNRNFGVNLISVHPHLEELADVCARMQVSHVVFAGGFPKKSMIEKLKKAHVRVICFAPSISMARRMVNMGVDGLIIEGMEAGGHIGPVSTSVLAQEILPHAKEIGVPVFVAGGIASGSMIAAYMRMGAAGCQIGTLFACSKECIAHKNFKDILIRSSARDATQSVQLSEELHVIPVRAIANKASREFMQLQAEMLSKYKDKIISKEEAQLNIEKFWAGALRRAVIDGDVEAGSLMAGQSVGMVTEEKSVIDILSGLILEAETELNKTEHFNLEGAI